MTLDVRDIVERSVPVERVSCGMYFGTQMRLTLKMINGELSKRVTMARLAKADGYFYFQFGEAAEWWDRTVNVTAVNALTLDQWLGEFDRLKKVNEQIMGTGKTKRKKR